MDAEGKHADDLSREADGAEQLRDGDGAVLQADLQAALDDAAAEEARIAQAAAAEPRPLAENQRLLDEQQRLTRKRIEDAATSRSNASTIRAGSVSSQVLLLHSFWPLLKWLISALASGDWWFRRGNWSREAG